jgi:hypothetical protein
MAYIKYKPSELEETLKDIAALYVQHYGRNSGNDFCLN